MIECQKIVCVYITVRSLNHFEHLKVLLFYFMYFFRLKVERRKGVCKCLVP